ncbi:MAG: right-handed parallel beta-helix repeat-containing protein, partial [Patescibacteria group bacterium]
HGSFLCVAAHTSSPNITGQIPAFQTDLAAGKWKIMTPRRQWYDVRDFGAKLDNTNDTAAIQAAIDACAAAGGGTVFIPAATTAVTQLIIKNHVWLRGAGRWATTIRCLSNTNAPVLKNFVSPDGVAANAEFFAILDLKIDGNKAGNSGSGSHGISITTNPLFTKAANDDWFDLHYLVQNVMIVNCPGIGLRATGRSEGRIKNVYVEKCDSGGIDPSFDTYIEGCSTGNCAGFGFSFTHGNIMAVDCKAFIMGRAYGLNAPGFYISGLGVGVTLSSCIAQNNNGQGFLLQNTAGVILAGCVADSNNYGDGNAADAHAGVELDNAQNCIIDFVSQQGFQVGQQVGNQGSALRLVSGSNHNDIRTVTYAQAGYALGPTCTADSVLLQNKVVANGALLNPLPELGDNGDVLIASPADGQTLQYSAAQSKWINSSAPLGTFASGMLGDGLDGSITLDGIATVPWATLVGSVYSMTRDAHTLSLTVNVGVTLVCAGYRIFSQGTVTNNGTVSANGTDATSSTGPGSSSPRSLGTGAKGGNGGTGNGTGGNPGGFGVGNGGAGGNGASGTGGVAISAITGLNWVLRDGQGIATGAIGYAGSVSVVSGGSGGSGGSGDGVNAGGGGGSGGSVIGVLARSFVNSSTGILTARGGNGHAPATGNCGGGGGGGGGGIFIFTISPAVNNGAAIVTAGTGGAGIGSGTGGNSGTAGTILFVQLQ